LSVEGYIQAIVCLVSLSFLSLLCRMPAHFVFSRSAKSLAVEVANTEVSPRYLISPMLMRRATRTFCS
jgi:hypothetical protein